MDLSEYHKYLSSSKPELWEQAYLSYVAQGKVSIDEWVLDWLWYRIQMPDTKEYSIFTPQNIIYANLMGIQVGLIVYHQSKERFVELQLFKSGDFHPYFEFANKADAQNNRFESVGNPIIDTPNYRWWEEYLFFKLTSEILFEHKGLDAIIEGVRRHY
jgi:hypothetical protein